MKTLTLSSGASLDGRSLSYTCTAPNLENKLLSQTSNTSLLRPQDSSTLLHSRSLLRPSLQQPSGLCSTASKLLTQTPPSSSSALLSTQNRLLPTESPLIAAPKRSAVSAAPLLNRFLHSGVKETDGGDQRRDAPIGVGCTGEDTTVHFSEDDVDMSEEECSMFEEEEESASAIFESPDLEEEETEVNLMEAEVLEQEFEDLKRDEKEERAKDKKYLLLNLVCCSLVNKSKSPGQAEWDSENSVWTELTKLAKDISEQDPEFLLKVAVYTRQELNIRITANFLLALAANLDSTKSHVRRYFCAAVQLPSDWLEVVRIYSTCFRRSLPTCLKKGLTDKFKEFSEYQLAKYNTRKHRCKHNKNKKSKKTAPSDQQLKRWANLVRSEPAVIKKLIMGDSKKQVVDKKQSEFSLKKMIKRLHIKEPAEYVMAILGRKYPSDAKAFTHSGIKGTWDRDRAGKRMKLKEPETWERLLCREGNKAATWEKLINNNSLPFMAMLRNLRNMITTGISEAHHKKILNKLTNKRAVIQSRQFPVRFLTAYKVMMELQSLATATVEAVPARKDILKEVLKKIPRSKRFQSQDWDQTPKSRLRCTLAMPLVYRLYKTKRAQLLSAASEATYSVDLLRRYREALEKAVQISCRYNVPPLPGKTVVLLNPGMQRTRCPQDFCLPPDFSEPKTDEDTTSQSRTRRRRGEKPEDPLSPTLLEVGALLSLMIGSSAEDFSLVLTNNDHWEEVKLGSDVLLENVRMITKRIKTLDDMNYEEREEEKKKIEAFSLSRQNKVDNIIVVTECWTSSDIDWAINNYRNDVNNKALHLQILLNYEDIERTTDRNRVTLTGFSDQMLRFVAERGSSRLLDHVEHLDKVYNIKPAEGAKEPLTGSAAVSVPASPSTRWQSVRVFVSSTFRDMHSERDVLVRSVFPELRRRAAPHCLHLQEVELRWGVTEEESSRAAELCLSEVCRSQVLLVLLGERYGLVPDKPQLPELPQYGWLSSAPEGLSITEMEIRQFEALYPNAAQERMFCYFRDPNITKSVPVAWRADFAPESREAESKMSALKRRLRDSEAKVTEDYPSEWGGVVDGKPYLKNLECFRKAVVEDLWAAVKEQFIESAEESAVLSEESEQEVHQESLCRQFFGRSKFLSTAVTLVEQAQTKGGLLVLEGGAGEGKTVFMAALGHALKTTKMKPRREVTSYSSAAAGQSSRSEVRTTHDVISFSTAASQSARSVENLLRFLVKRLRNINDTEEETPLPQSYRELVSEFHSTLSRHKKNRPVVVLVDGVDLLQDGSGHIISDWIPQHLPQGVCLVTSVPTSSSLLQTLVKRKGTLLFTLAQLTMTDRKEIVQKRLDAFGKKLSDSAFNNQVQTLIMKKGAVSPLYLHLACEDLKNFASFDKLKNSLQTLPQSLPQLVLLSLDRLCSEHRGILGLRWALAALTVSSTGLKERELYAVLNTCNDLSTTQGALSWDSALELSRRPRGRVPMATFTRIVHSLESFVGHCSSTNDLLVLSNPEVRRAFQEFFLPTEIDRRRAHLVLAAHLWTASDPMGADTFLHCEASSLMQLPHSLMQSNQKEALTSLLYSYYFLFANVRHGLLHHLLEIYNSFNCSDVEAVDCLSFLRRHSSLLSSWPALFVQQALNEAPETSAHIWAQSMMGKGGVRAVKWLNNTQNNLEMSALVSSFSCEPSCLVLSPDGQMMVVGTGRGTLHFVHAQTGQEVRSLVSSCDGVSSCVFVRDGSLATTSFDGKIEMWDVDNGCRTAVVNGHNNAITGSDLSADRTLLATASLDFTLKVWSSSKAEQVASLHSTSPMNCVTFDPDGHVLAAGCWNGKVTVWNWIQNKTIASLAGHGRSVHSVAFSSSSLLCSGSFSGEVRVWSVSGASCVGCFQAHGGSTEALTFIDNGRRLLTAGADHMLQLWSGGLGRSVTTLKTEKCPSEPLQKRRRAPPTDPALCVSVTGDTAAVGTRDGIKLYDLDSGETIWTSENLPSSVHCLLWVSVDLSLDQDQDQDQSETRPRTELLVSGGQDRLVRVWRERDEEEGLMGGLEEAAVLDSHQGAVLALAKNDTYLATASDDCSVALWRLSDLVSSVAPHSVLRAHSRGVSCVAFSPDGERLLSGGKDQALMLWDMSSTPVLLKSLLHCHRDWITGCAWTEDCVVSSSNDGRLCFWDLETGKSVKEFSWNSPLTSVCCRGPYVTSGCSEGGLHVWNWDSAVEICHISAHHGSIHHCALITEAKESNPEDLTVATASEDGTTKVWKPLQVEHCGTFLGHTGAIRGVVPKTEGSELLTVSEDGSVRRWDSNTESPPFRTGSVTALCFCQRNALLVAGFECGLLEFWLNNRVVGHKQVSKGAVTALCSVPDGQVAVGYSEPRVDVFRLTWTQSGTVSLVKVKSYDVDEPVISLTFCSLLLAVTADGMILNVSNEERKTNPWSHRITHWHHNVRFLSSAPNDEKSAWMMGESEGDVHLGFVFSLGSKYELSSSFGTLKLASDDEENEKKDKGPLITAGAVDNDFLVFGDVRGNMWFNLPPELSSWSNRKPVHSDRITALRLTKDTIVSASHDKTVKMWDRRTKKQLGMFVCRAPVVLLEVNPEDKTKLVCGDRLGNLYFLSWTQ